MPQVKMTDADATLAASALTTAAAEYDKCAELFRGPDHGLPASVGKEKLALIVRQFEDQAAAARRLSRAFEHAAWDGANEVTDASNPEHTDDAPDSGADGSNVWDGMTERPGYC